MLRENSELAACKTLASQAWVIDRLRLAEGLAPLAACCRISRSRLAPLFGQETAAARISEVPGQREQNAREAAAT